MRFNCRRRAVAIFKQGKKRRSTKRSGSSLNRNYHCAAVVAWARRIWTGVLVTSISVHPPYSPLQPRSACLLVDEAHAISHEQLSLPNLLVWRLGLSSTLPIAITKQTSPEMHRVWSLCELKTTTRGHGNCPRAHNDVPSLLRTVCVVEYSHAREGTAYSSMIRRSTTNEATWQTRRRTNKRTNERTNEREHFCSTTTTAANNYSLYRTHINPSMLTFHRHTDDNTKNISTEYRENGIVGVLEE